MPKKSFAADRRQPSPADLAEFIRHGAGTDTDRPPARRDDTRRAEAASKLRFTFEMPEDLHARYKAACARNRLKMGPDILALVQARLLELEQ